jgi:membrane protein required for colicin V production
MTWIDFVILGIIFISAVFSLFRGFVREAVSLAAWVLAFWVALTLAHPVAQFLRGIIHTTSLRLAIAYAGLFILMLIAGVIVNYLAGQLVKGSGFSGTDRMLGVVFGIGRGIAIVTLLVLLAGFTTLPRDPWWQHSALIGQIEPFALWVHQRLPPDMANHIHYNERTTTIKG